MRQSVLSRFYYLNFYKNNVITFTEIDNNYSTTDERDGSQQIEEERLLENDLLVIQKDSRQSSKQDMSQKQAKGKQKPYNETGLIGKTKKGFSCDSCGKTFVSKINLNKHMHNHCLKKISNLNERVVSKSKNKFTCNLCEKTFVSQYNLKNHQMRIHTESSTLKSYDCKNCKKSFCSKPDLERHILTHTGEKPFKCDKCGKRFRHFNSFTYHQRVHTGEKPYTCDICGISFIRIYNLTEHKHIHTGEKPYSCVVCKKTFAQRTNLNQHKRIHKSK